MVSSNMNVVLSYYAVLPKSLNYLHHVVVSMLSQYFFTIDMKICIICKKVNEAIIHM